jgi:hypothetical protein
VRPEQQPTPHDQSNIFSATNAPPSSPAFETQPDQGKMLGFDFNPDEIRKRGVFPYPSLPHPKHVSGAMVFPQMQIEMFPRLERFDVQFDIPDAVLPEFPAAIFLQNRPELGDVSRGEVVSINNFHRLFKDLLTPVQLDGLRLVVTPFPQEEFNATDDRKTMQPSLGFLASTVI